VYDAINGIFAPSGPWERRYQMDQIQLQKLRSDIELFEGLITGALQ